MNITKDKKIIIQHLAYTVEIKDSKKAKGEVKEFLHKYVACSQEIDRHKTIIWVQFPIIESEIPTILHELIHALQNICKWHAIDFVEETEHVAYIYHYMVNEALGYKYDL